MVEQVLILLNRLNKLWKMWPLMKEVQPALNHHYPGILLKMLHLLYIRAFHWHCWKGWVMFLAFIFMYHSILIVLNEHYLILEHLQLLTLSRNYVFFFPYPPPLAPPIFFLIQSFKNIFEVETVFLKESKPCQAKSWKVYPIFRFVPKRLPE